MGQIWSMAVAHLSSLMGRRSGCYYKQHCSRHLFIDSAAFSGVCWVHLEDKKSEITETIFLSWKILSQVVFIEFKESSEKKRVRSPLSKSPQQEQDWKWLSRHLTRAPGWGFTCSLFWDMESERPKCSSVTQSRVTETKSLNARRSLFLSALVFAACDHSRSCFRPTFSKT